MPTRHGCAAEKADPATQPYEAHLSFALAVWSIGGGWRGERNDFNFVFQSIVSVQTLYCEGALTDYTSSHNALAAAKSFGYSATMSTLSLW